jgi:hypothetical protein
MCGRRALEVNSSIRQQLGVLLKLKLIATHSWVTIGKKKYLNPAKQWVFLPSQGPRRRFRSTSNAKFVKGFADMKMSANCQFVDLRQCPGSRIREFLDLPDTFTLLFVRTRNLDTDSSINIKK